MKAFVRWMNTPCIPYYVAWPLVPLLAVAIIVLVRVALRWGSQP